MGPPLSSPQAKELFLLPGDEINPGIFQQCGEYKEQADSHPDINGFHVRDLGREKQSLLSDAAMGHHQVTV